MFIEAENIRKSYGRKTIVLNGASFHAASGEYIAIVGANGCGKSTLLEILAGSLKADGGSLKIDGTDAFADAKMFQKYIGFVPQENNLNQNQPRQTGRPAHQPPTNYPANGRQQQQIASAETTEDLFTQGKGHYLRNHT